ncbi:MAG: hypothetical protein CL677_01645 [Bdellovibrionaceae bacterium]|nr:hypothetical protein [Pseudobdellovibrionaceae bacterium]|tara:strand:+ start:117509 stop:119152 length:1644 start_codon:yes stop_codon:yes gene_type:complete
MLHAFRVCLFFLLSSSFYSLSFAGTECEEIALRTAPGENGRLVFTESLEADLLQCLEEYGQSLISGKDSVGAVEMDTYLNDIKDKKAARVKANGTFGRGIQFDRLNPIPLEHQYIIRVPKRALGIEGRIVEGQCFDLTRAPYLNSDEARLNFTIAIKDQLIEIAKFLGHFHAKTLGGEASLIFQPRQIKLCNQNQFYYTAEHGSERQLMYGDHTLHFGIPNIKRPARIEVLSAQDINELWNDGDIIRKVPKDYDYDLERESITEIPADVLTSDTDERLYGFNRDGQKEELITELLAKYWGFLNPMGTLRSSARYILTGIVHKSFSPRPSYNSDPAIQHFTLKSTYQSLMRTGEQFFDPVNIEFYKEKIEPSKERLKAFHNMFQDVAMSPSMISQSIESNIADTAHSDMGMIIQMQEQLCLGVAVTNNHTITSMVDFLRTGSNPDMSNFTLGNYGDAQMDIIREDNWLDTDTTKIRFRGNGKLIEAMQVNMARQTGIFACTNTSDKVTTSLQIPTMSSSEYRSKALNSFIGSVREDADLLADFVDRLD